MTRYMLPLAAAALLSACTGTAGDLITHDRFKFPNSVVKVDNNSNFSVERSVTLASWSTPDLKTIYDELRAEALVKAGQSSGITYNYGTGERNPILINEKWVTSVTVYPLIPIATYKFRLEGTVGTARIFEDNLYRK